MPLEFKADPESRSLEIRATEKLTKEDYKRFAPESEQLIQQSGKIDCLFVMHDFHGWEIGALWEDVKFDIRHFNDIERLAIVGEKKWQKWMTDFCRPFTSADIRYYELSQEDEARAWLSTNPTSE